MLDPLHRDFCDHLRQQHGLARHAARYLARYFQFEAEGGENRCEPQDPTMRSIYVNWLANRASARPDARIVTTPLPVPRGGRLRRDIVEVARNRIDGQARL